MPIRAQHRWLYPIDWPQISAAIRFGRAKGRCEQCGRPHGHGPPPRRWALVGRGCKRWRNGRGRSAGEACEPLARDQGRLTTRVFLAAAHLNHDPGDNRPRNLRAFCQRCHMLHDHEDIVVDDGSRIGRATRLAIYS